VKKEAKEEAEKGAKEEAEKEAKEEATTSSAKRRSSAERSAVSEMSPGKRKKLEELSVEHCPHLQPTEGSRGRRRQHGWYNKQQDN
jgi:hypothetical protein